MDSFSLESWLPILSLAGWLLLLMIPALLLYGYLADQAVFEGMGKVRADVFGWFDILIAAVLAGLFSMYVYLAATAGGEEPKITDATRMIEGIAVNEVIFVVLVGGFLLSMKARGIRLREAFGLNRLGFAGVIVSAFLLIMLAYPLIAGVLQISRVLLAGFGYRNDDPQEAVRFLVRDHSAAGRAAVAISAIVLAPLQEELIFRGYIYGVVRRYAGVTVGVLFNAALFAAIHIHPPSLGGLFVLAVCLTLAYEWTGSLFVPMAMHAMFNSVAVISLLAGAPTDG